jgi:hypothetical protein
MQKFSALCDRGGVVTQTCYYTHGWFLEHHGSEASPGLIHLLNILVRQRFYGEKSMKYIVTLVLLLLFTAPLQAQFMSAEAEADIAKSRAMINDKRNTALAFNMKFSAEESAAFWPMYEDYRNAMSNVATRKLAVIVDYANHYEEMTQDKAADILNRAMIYEEQALKVQQLYIKKFMQILPATKVTRLFQIEHRMDAAIALKLAEGIPLME